MHDPGALKSLVFDNTSGAREITERALGLLERTLAESMATTPDELLDQVADVGTKLVRGKPEMPQLFHALNRFLLDAEAREGTASDVNAFRSELLPLLADHQRAHKNSLERVAEAAQPRIMNGSVLVTHSRSSTVLEVLKRARREGRLFDVVASEGRPLLEGRVLARELAAESIPTRLVVDALLGTAVEGADRVLLGADAVTPDAFVNKAGTSLLALAAKAAGVPVTLVAESGKAWVKRLDPNLGLLTGRHRDPKEVWDAAPYGIEVVNLYFDRTPMALVDEVIDEDGAGPPSRFWETLKRRGFARRVADAFPGELL